MSSGTMRTIAQQFLLGANIPGLSVVKRGWDHQMQFIGLGGNSPAQTLSALHIGDEVDRRVATPAVAGKVMVYYDLQLQICVVLNETDGDKMVDTTDALVEAVKNRLRSDPLMGQLPSAVFESAQGMNPLIHVKRGDVQYIDTGMANGVPIQWVAVYWTAAEMITA